MELQHNEKMLLGFTDNNKHFNTDRLSCDLPLIYTYNNNDS